MKIKTTAKLPHLLTKIITFDGSEDGWTFYRDAGAGTWVRWGNITMPNDFPKPTSNSQKVNTRSKTYLYGSISELTTPSFASTYNVYSVDTNNILCIRPKNDITNITTLEQFKAWLHDNPITIEYLLASSNWGGLH